MNKSLIILLAGLAIFLPGCSSQQGERAIATEEIAPVETTRVISMKPIREVILPGELKPWNRTNMYAKVKGYVGEVYVDRGSRVKKGERLAQLEAPEIEAEMSNALARASSAEAQLIEQAARLRASKLTYQRMLKTSQTPGAISPNELDQALSGMAADSALNRSLESALIAAKAQLASQRQLVNYLSIRAAFDGTIIERNVSPGVLTGPSEGNGKPLFVLEDQSRLRLSVAIPEYLSKSISESSTVSFSVTSDPFIQFTAGFGRSANSLQETNRTMMAEFDFDNKAGDLKPGMYAEIKLPMSRNVPTLFVPATAIFSSPEGNFVIKVKDGAAEWVAVQRGNQSDSLTEVFGDLKEGDVIVTKASEELRDGHVLQVSSH